MKLKVAVALTVLFGLIATPGFAQPMVTGGIKGGLNLANLKFDPDEGDFKNKVGAAVGGFVNVGLTDMIAFQPEILFSMKGAKQEDFGETFKVNLTYIQIPLLLHANIPTSGSVQPFIAVGPGLGLRMSAKLSGGGEEEDIKDDTKSSDFSLIVGGGVKVGRATVEARYDLGLTNISKDGEGGDEKVKTRTITILVGFGIGGSN